MSSCREIVLDEFQLKRISLKHHNFGDFLCSQWQLPSEKSIIYVMYKWIVAITYFAILINSMVHHALNRGTLDFYFLNLTHWGCLVNTTYACVGAGLVTYHNLRRKLIERHQLPCIVKFYWLLYYICINNALVVTTLYWGLVYKPNDEYHRLDMNNVLIHIMNSIIMLVELCVTATPFRLLHVVYPITFEAIYTGFSVLYYLGGGLNVKGKPYIYKALDWSTPWKTIGPTIGAFIWLTIMHCVFFTIHQMKIYLCNQRKRTNLEAEKLQNGSNGSCDSAEIK